MMAPQPLIKSNKAERTINGLPTQVVCTEFSNYIFIVLTQYGKIGTLVSVTPDTRSGDISVPMYTSRVLLGKDEVIHYKHRMGFLWDYHSERDKVLFEFYPWWLYSLVSLQPLTHVYAKNVATFVSQASGNRPVLLGLSMKDNGAETMKTIKDMIKSCQVW